jgi:hypothetical protein
MIQDATQEAASQYLNARSGGGSAALILDPDWAGPETFFLRLQFTRLAQTWKRETAHIASGSKTVMHPAYQAIIGMGRQALPLILEDLQRNGGHWFWALHAIAQEDPAQGHADFAEAAQAWLDWGRRHGYMTA